MSLKNVEIALTELNNAIRTLTEKEKEELVKDCKKLIETLAEAQDFWRKENELEKLSQ